jgi:hypothetical protein
MTGGGLPQDEKTENKVQNLRLKFLEELQGVAKKAFVEAGVMEGGICPVGVVMAQEFQSSSGWVNASDTWTCKLADSENDIVKSNVNSVSAAGASLLSGIDAEISNIHANGKDMVDENDEDAKWKPF